MIDEQALRERYSLDAVPIRLGNLASSAKRLGYFSHKAKHESATGQLFEECRWFISWTHDEAEFETQLALAELNTELTAWQSEHAKRKSEESLRSAVNNACAQWSQRLLELSGLLKVNPQTLPREKVFLFDKNPE